MLQSDCIGHGKRKRITKKVFSIEHGKLKKSRKDEIEKSTVSLTRQRLHDILKLCTKGNEQSCQICYVQRGGGRHR